MIFPPKGVHPEGEHKFAISQGKISILNAETFNGKIHVEWDPQAQVTPMGQLPFFIQYLVGPEYIFKPLIMINNFKIMSDHFDHKW